LELLSGGHVDNLGLGETGREGMVERNRIFRLLLFSGILGQAREVHLKFRNEIPENVLSIRSSPGTSGILGLMKARLMFHLLIGCRTRQKLRIAGYWPQTR